MTPLRRLSARRECEILDILTAGPATRAAIARRAGITPHQVGRYLTVLRKAGAINYRFNGNGRQRDWYVVVALAEPEECAGDDHAWLPAGIVWRGGEECYQWRCINCPAVKYEGKDNATQT